MDDPRTALKQAIEDTLQFISYAAHRGIPLGNDELRKVIEAYRAGEAVTAEQEQNFWIAATSISKAVAPVTIDSLQASAERFSTNPASAARAARRYRIRTGATLVTLLLFQIYWLIGATVTSNLNELKERLLTLDTERIRLAGITEPTETDQNYQSLKTQREALNARILTERISAATNFEVLKTWNIAKRLLLWGRTPKETNTESPSPSGSGRVSITDYSLWEFTTENVVELRTAEIILTAILKYILPILYGALGASAYIVRSLATEIRDQTYSRASNVTYQLRFYLGAVAGLSIAWFTSDVKSSETAGILQSLSPLALAFLAGYSVELLFSLLDRIVLAFSNVEPVKPKSS
jgi:hypothetical protein